MPVLEVQASHYFIVLLSAELRLLGVRAVGGAIVLGEVRVLVSRVVPIKLRLELVQGILIVISASLVVVRDLALLSALFLALHAARDEVVDVERRWRVAEARNAVSVVQALLLVFRTDAQNELVPLQVILVLQLPEVARTIVFKPVRQGSIQATLRAGEDFSATFVLHFAVNCTALGAFVAWLTRSRNVIGGLTAQNGESALLWTLMLFYWPVDFMRGLYQAFFFEVKNQGALLSFV